MQFYSYFRKRKKTKKKTNSIRIVKEKAFTQMTIREKTKNVKLRNKNKNI